MSELPDPDWYLDNVLIHAEPGGAAVVLGPAAEWNEWWTRQSGEPLLQHGRSIVLSAAELAEAGISRQAARTRIRRGVWTNGGWGFVAPINIASERRFVADRRRHAVEAVAAARRRPGHVVSGRSAAIQQGLPIFRIPTRPELTGPGSDGLGRARGLSHVYGAGLHSVDVTTWFGCPLTTVARTLVDLGRHDRWDAIMAADAALRERLVDRASLARALARAAGWPGVRQARAVLALADPRAESPLESLTRLRLHDDDFPLPDLQAWFGRDRVDMVFKKQRVILEIDGLEKYVGNAQQLEKLREVRLRRYGYRVERVTWDDIVNHWPATARWLREILRLPASSG